MREIKFRAWRSEGRGMFYFTPFTQSTDKDGWTIIQLSNALAPVVMQFTGLKDKNGKEIYEGDILAFKMDGVGPSKIEWTGAGFWVKISDQWEGERWIVPGQHSCEVIGNIYENPELVKP